MSKLIALLDACVLYPAPLRDLFMQLALTDLFQAKWAKKENVSDKAIKKAVSEMQSGLIYAELGDGLCEQRIARPGQGKRGGHRTLVAFQKDDRSIFVFGFSKNEHENINEEDEKKYRELAQFYLNLSGEQLNKMISEKRLIEVKTQWWRMKVFVHCSK